MNMKKVMYLRNTMFTALLFCAAAVFGQEKYALVIGNANYTAMSVLMSPVNDARAMKSALESLGWNVDILENADRVKTEDGINKLKDKLETSQWAVYGFFFYIGTQCGSQRSELSYSCGRAGSK